MATNIKKKKVSELPEATDTSGFWIFGSKTIGGAVTSVKFAFDKITSLFGVTSDKGQSVTLAVSQKLFTDEITKKLDFKEYVYATIETIPYNAASTGSGTDLNTINNGYFYNDASSLYGKIIYSIKANIQAVGDLLVIVGKNPSGAFVETSRQSITVNKTDEQEIILTSPIKLLEGETIGFGSLATRMFGLKYNPAVPNPVAGGYVWRQLTTGEKGSVNGNICIGVNTVASNENSAIVDVSSLVSADYLSLESAISKLPEKYYSLNRLISFNENVNAPANPKELILKNYAINANGNVAANTGTDIIYMYPVKTGDTITIKAASAFNPLIRTYAAKGMNNTYVRYLDSMGYQKEHTFTAQAGENFICFYTKLPAGTWGSAFNINDSIEIIGGQTEEKPQRTYFKYYGTDLSVSEIQNADNWQKVDFISDTTETENTAIAFNPASNNIFNIDDFAGSDIQKINTAIEFANMVGGGTVEITRDVLITESIIMRSNVYLTFTGLIKMADGVFDNIVRCYGVVVNPNAPYADCLELNETSNIKLLGIGENARIEHADVPKRAANPKTGIVQDWVTDKYGWRTISVLMSNCKNYEIGNFFITKTPCWAISQEWGCRWGHVHDIEIDATLINRDCVNMRNGCRDILVERIRGRAGDDVIACTALDNTVWSVSSAYIYPLQTMGYEYKKGDEAGIFDITIRDVHASSPYNTVDIVCTTPKIQRINIMNISDDGTGNWTQWDVVGMMAAFGTGYTKGNVKDIRVSNITSKKSPYCVKVSLDITDSWLNNLKQEKAGGQTHTVTAGSDNVKITNI